MRLLTILMAIAFLSVSANNAEAEQVYVTPIVDDAVHEGVITCYGSTCHSRQTASGSHVRQNEIITWQDQSDISGAHSRAYKVLLNKKSQTIARNLGIGPAHEAAECLACHADFVPEERRGERFDLTEGVGCEACHDGAEKWLTTHYAPNRTHAENLADGLYPTEDPVARAELCLGCHIGSKVEDQFITHRIMGAGHPRISFELDLFTNLQRHHDEDSDYAERKTISSGVKTWAIGQSISIKRQVTLFADNKLGRFGAFPELVFFDCHACHTTFSNDPDWQPTWRPNPERRLGPGVPIFNDSNLIMLKAAVKTVAPELDSELSRSGMDFHKAVSARNGGNYKQASENLLTTLDKVTEKMSQASFSKDNTVSMMKLIVNESMSRRYTDYASAEQAVIAVDTFLEALTKAESISVQQAQSLRPAIDRAYKVVSKPNSYNQTKMRDAFKALSTEINRL